MPLLRQNHSWQLQEARRGTYEDAQVCEEMWITDNYFVQMRNGIRNASRK